MQQNEARRKDLFHYFVITGSDKYFTTITEQYYRRAFREWVVTLHISFTLTSLAPQPIL